MKYINFLNWLTPKITWIIPLGILWITIGILAPSVLTCFNIIPITQDSIETLIDHRISTSIAFLGIPIAIMGFIMAIIAMKENVILTLVFEFTGYYSIIYFSILIILCFGVLSILQANLGNNEWFINATLSLNYLFFLNFLSVFYLISKISKITSIENLINLVESKFTKNEAGMYTDFYNQQLIKKVKENDYNTIHFLLNSLANIFKEISIENFGNHIDTIKNIESKAVLNKDLDLIDKLLEFHTTIKKKGKEVNKENYGNLENLPIDIYNTSNKIHPKDCKSNYYHEQLVTKILENLSKLYIDNIIDYNTFCSKYTSLTNAFIKSNDETALRNAIKELYSIYKNIKDVEGEKIFFKK